MKIKKTIPVFILLLLSVIIYSKDITKTYNKTYNVNENMNVELENKYGAITITNWDKNVVEVKIDVITDESDVNKIKIDFSESPKKIGIETIFPNSFLGFFTESLSSKTKNYKINYYIKTPVNLTYKIKQKYGSISIEKLTKPVQIELKYGSLDAKELLSLGGTSKFEIGYSTVKIENIGDLNLEAKYSKINIKKSKKIVLDSKYNNIIVENCNVINCESKYDKIHVDELDKLNIVSKHTKINITKLNKEVNSEIKYGELIIDSMTENFNNINISNKYAEIKIGLSDKSTYNLSLELEHCPFKSGSQFESDGILLINRSINNAKPEDRNVIISSEYGSVNLNR